MSKRVTLVRSSIFFSKFHRWSYRCSLLLIIWNKHSTISSGVLRRLFGFCKPLHNASTFRSILNYQHETISNVFKSWMVNSLSFGLNVHNAGPTAMCDIDIKDHLLYEARKVFNTLDSFETLIIIISSFYKTLSTLENHKKYFLPLRFRKPGRVWYGGAREIQEPRVRIDWLFF